MKCSSLRYRFSSLLTVLAIPATCLAWGADGHRIVARIAEHQLTPRTAAAVKDLLEDSLPDISNWADEIREDPEYYWTERLHFVNVAPGAEGFDLKRDCRDGKCVVAAIATYAKVLRSSGASQSDREEALKFLVHFVADVHQPLHVALAHDEGGNDIRVEFFRNPTNLHRVWDTAIIRRALKGRGWSNYARQIEGRIKPDQRKDWLKVTDPSLWATESFKLAMSNAYNIPKDGVLGAEYFDRNRPVIEQRLAMAGIRLGAMLNAIFDQASALPSPPAEGASQSRTGTRENPRIDINADVSKFARGWMAKDCGAEANGDGSLSPGIHDVAGRKNVLVTHPLSETMPCILGRRVDILPDKKASLHLVVGHHPDGDWVLSVTADRELVHKVIGKQTAPDGWTNIDVDLSAYAGQIITIQLINASNGGGHESAYWGKIEIEQ